MVGRLVVLSSPFFVAAATWITGFVAEQIPGVQLDSGQVAALMAAAATSAITGIWKWLQGWQQHERLVAEGLAKARKPVPPTS